MVVTKNIQGACGNSKIRVMGITEVLDDFFTTDVDAGVIIVRVEGKKDLQINYPIVDDATGIACISTKQGGRLLIWSNCSGNGYRCGNGFSFFIVDPERQLFIVPKDPINDRCDDECATRSLGSKLPLE